MRLPFWRKKEPEAKPKPKGTPYIHIHSLKDQDEIDLFPRYKKDMDGEHGKLINSLKDGTYMPYMRQETYIPKAGRTGDGKMMTVTASMKNEDITVSDKAIFMRAVKVPKRILTREASMNADEIRRMENIYSKHKVPVTRRYTANPYQFYDHILFNDQHINSPAGMVQEALMDFVMTKDFRPVVYYRDSDAEENEADIKEKKEILKALMAVDLWYSDKGSDEQDPYYDVPVKRKIRSAAMNMMVYGRGMIVKEYWKSIPAVKVDGKEYRNIPNVLKVLESQDIGMTEIEEYSGKMAGVWLNNSRPYVPASEMMYFVDAFDSPMMGSTSYGFAPSQRALDACRLWRRLLAVNLPQWLRVGATGMGIFLMNTTGMPEEEREKVEAALTGMFESGEMAVISYGNVGDFDFKEIKLTTDISHLVELLKALSEVISSVLGVPYTLLFTDTTAARATMVGKMVAYLEYPIANKQERLAEMISHQHYIPNFRALYKKDKPEYLEKYTIGVEFEETNMETKQEKVDRLLGMMEINPLTDKRIGEELDDTDYEKHIDKDKIKERKEEREKGIQPQGQGQNPKTGQTMTIRDHATGDKTKQSVRTH